MKMKAVFMLLVCIAVVVPVFAAYAETDSYMDRNYDFSAIKRLYVWPVIIEAMPDNYSLSMPNLAYDWAIDALGNKKMKQSILVKSTEKMWSDAKFLYGDGEVTYKRPFENEESENFFHDAIGKGGLCDVLCVVTVNMTEERHWREPRTETYTVTERVRSVERRRRSNGKYEEVEVYTDIPVTKQRTIPGAWIVTVRGFCLVELFDDENLSGKHIAAAKTPFVNSYNESSESSPAKRLIQRAVEDSIASLFYK